MSLDLPRTWAAQHQLNTSVPLPSGGKAGGGGEGRNTPTLGGAGGDEQHGGPPWLDLIALFARAQPARGQFTFQGQILPTLRDMSC